MRFRPIRARADAGGDGASNKLLWCLFRAQAGQIGICPMPPKATAIVTFIFQPVKAIRLRDVSVSRLKGKAPALTGDSLPLRLKLLCGLAFCRSHRLKVRQTARIAIIVTTTMRNVI